MLWEELVLKLFFEIVVLGLLLFVISGFGLNFLICFPVAFFLAHTVNWLLNGHFFNLIRYLGAGKKDYKWFIAYPDKMRKRLSGKKSISSVALYGSFSRGAFTATSDLDVRIIARLGLVNTFVASWFACYERFLAFFARYPIDIYTVTQTRGLEKLRNDEPPVILIDNDDFIRRSYKKFIYFDSIVKLCHPKK